MSFKGDVAQIPLSNILQALLLNNQEGILTLESVLFKRNIAVLKTGLRILNYNPEVPDTLQYILVKDKLLTESQFQNIFSSWIPGSSYPGDFLISRRIITEQQVTTRILHQIENLVLELIIHPALKYEFVANADTTEFEIFSPDTLGQQLVLSSSAVLMESVRRDDELRRIKELIPLDTEIYTFTDKRSLSSNTSDINQDCLKEIRPFLNGEFTIERIASASALSTFETYQTIHQLLKRGIIVPLSLTQKKLLADKFRKSLRENDAIETLRSVVRSDPQDNESRLKLANLLEKSKQCPNELAEHYIALSTHTASSDTLQAIKFLQQCLHICPNNLNAIERLFTIYNNAKDHRNAIATARTIAHCQGTSNTVDQAIALLYKLINFYPKEPLLFHHLADVYIHTKDINSAASCLQTAAELYDANGDTSKAAKTYQLIARIKPSQTITLKRVLQQTSRSTTNLKTILKWTLRTLLITSILFVCLFFAISEYNSRVAFATALAESRHLATSGDLIKARTILENFQQQFPHSTRLTLAYAEIASVNQLFKTQALQTEKSAQESQLATAALLTRATVAFTETNYVKSYELLSQIAFHFLPPGRQNDAKTLLNYLTLYFDQANNLLINAQAAENNQDFLTSHALRKDILLNFPYSKAATGLLLPVRIESLPSSAEISLDGQVVGKTPILLRLPIRKLPSIVLTKTGYSQFEFVRKYSQSKPFLVTDSHVVTIKLDKTTDWQLTTDSSIEGSPAVVGDNIVFATRNGLIYCLKQSTGDIVWTFKVPDNTDCAGGIGVWRSMVYFGAFDGRIYVLDANTGNLWSEPFLATSDQLPIKLAPSAASEAGIVAVNCDTRIIASVNIETAKTQWMMSASSGYFLGQPQLFHEKLYIVTSLGDLLQVHHDTGKVLMKVSLGSEVTSRGRLVGNYYFIGTILGRLICYDILKKQASWTYECGDSIASPPTVDGDWVAVTTVKGKVHCLSTSGEPKWAYFSGESCAHEVDGTVFRNYLLLGTESGTVYSLDFWSGSLLWDFKTTGFQEKKRRGILAKGVVSKGRYFIGSEDHTFYCFLLD